MNKPAPDQQTAAIEARLFKDTSAYQDIMDLPATQLDFRRGRLMLTRKQEWELIIANLRKVTVVTRK